MNTTQKKTIIRWITTFFAVAFALITLFGVVLSQTWAIVITMLAFAGMVIFIISYWICSFINEWRIMGVLTPDEYQIYKWYRVFSKGHPPEDYAKVAKDPVVKHVYTKASFAKRITFFDD